MGESADRIGIHRDCGGDVVLADQAFLCERCGTQNWTADYDGPYDPDLHEKILAPEEPSDG